MPFPKKALLTFRLPDISSLVDHFKDRRPFLALPQLPRGDPLDAAAKAPEVMKTVGETAFAADEELIQRMMQWRDDGQPAANGWTSPHTLGAFGNDYIHRAGIMYAGPYDNRATETMYYCTDNDSALKQLNGASLYAVTFPKGQRRGRAFGP